MSIKTLEDLKAKIEDMGDDSEDFVEQEDETTEETEEEEKPAEEDDAEQDSEEETKPEEDETETEEGDSEETETEETSKYEANLKYKAMKEEYELPDYLKDVIDSEEKETEIKKIYSKAMGMDHFAAKNETMRSQLDETTQVVQEVQHFNALLDKKEHHAALQLAGVQDDDILKLAGKILELRDLTPDQQQSYNNGIQSNHRLHQLELDNQRLQQQFTDSNDQNIVDQLTVEVQSEGTGSISQSYDQRMGKAGAFREAVINNAAMVEYQTRNNPNGPTILSPKEAVARFVQMSGLESTQQVTKQVGDAVIPNASEKPTVIVKKDKPTIPNYKAGNKNPVKKKVKTLDDLKKIAEGLDDY